MASAPSVGRGFFPLDEELGLLPGKLTPQGHENLVRLGSWMPFEQAVKIYGDLMGIHVSRIVSQRYTEEAGAAYEEIQAEEVERLEKEMPEPQAGSERLQVSADGAMVPLVHGIWAEVKTVVIGEVQKDIEKKGELSVRTQNMSYFSRKTDAETFGNLALVEFHRRGVEKAQAVAAIMDGAEWEQGFIDYHCPQATRILDFAHAAEHVSAIGQAVYGENTPESQTWLEQQLHDLKHHGPNQLLLDVQELKAQHSDSQEIAKNLAYLTKRQEQMRYPTFQAQGWPIGSGVVESANKIVVEARLKGSGMHWAEEHVNPMLCLRNIICSDRWNEEWPKIEARLRSQTRKRREALYRKRHPAPQKASLPDVLPATPEITIHEPAPNFPPQPKSNPWRNFKHGKALFQHHPSPKV
jgi:hypothetical protein